MKKILLLLTIIAACHFGFTQTITRLDKSKISFADLDRKVQFLMKAANVQGLAISVFNNNEAIYKKTFGYKNFNTKEPLQTNSNIYGASLSKVVFAMLVMKLVEEGKLCLSHTSGFNNWRWFEPDQKLRVHFRPGQRYSYSGEGMVYLQVVLEKMFNTSLEKLMQEKIFDPLHMNMSAYTWLPAFEKDYSLGHNKMSQTYEKDKDNDARAPSTLETTLDDYTVFTNAVLQNTIIQPATAKQMFTPQISIKTIKQFGPLSLRDSTGNDGIALSYGLGWVLLKSPYGAGAFKEGHGDGFQHYSIIFPEAGTGIVIMTNSDNGESIFKELLEYAIGDTYTPWRWENYIPYNHK